MNPQTAAILTRNGSIQLELPTPETELMKGVRWGAVDAFPTPAYWAYQVLYRRLVGRPPQYKLGRTLAEEVGACLLGGHGIPAQVGLAAYERLRTRGAFSQQGVGVQELEAWLKEPLQMGGRAIRYRFAAQKARYLATALPATHLAPAFNVGTELRDWLVKLPGIGPKTASWVTRNWLGADDVAILDIHIMRVGQVIGLFPPELTVERHYKELEKRFLEMSAALDVHASELDAVIWYEMASSPATVRYLLKYLRAEEEARAPAAARSRTVVQPVLEFAA